jgi:hypothetical protein
MEPTEDLEALLNRLSQEVKREADGEIETTDDYKDGFQAGVDALRVAFLATVS